MSSVCRLQVEEMACEGCQSSVDEALRKFPGVADVNVNLESKIATVTLNDSKLFIVQDAVNKLTQLGYPAKKLD